MRLPSLGPGFGVTVDTVVLFLLQCSTAPAPAKGSDSSFPVLDSLRGFSQVPEGLAWRSWVGGWPSDLRKACVPHLPGVFSPLPPASLLWHSLLPLSSLLSLFLFSPCHFLYTKSHKLRSLWGPGNTIAGHRGVSECLPHLQDTLCPANCQVGRPTTFSREAGNMLFILGPYS